MTSEVNDVGEGIPATSVRATVTYRNTGVYAQPAMAGSALATLDSGATVTVLDRDPLSEFARIRTDGGVEGYVQNIALSGGVTGIETEAALQPSTLSPAPAAQAQTSAPVLSAPYSPGEYVPPARRSWSILAILMSVCALFVIVGSVAPWATAGDQTLNGTDADGKIFLVIALIAGGLALSNIAQTTSHRWTNRLAILAFGFVAFFGIKDLSNLSDLSSTYTDLNTGWGLVVCVLAAAAGAVLSIVSALVNSSASW